jgi:hypothetical protein
MEFSGTIGVLWRRKLLTLTLLLLTLLGTVGAGLLLPWTYQESATVTLLNSQRSSATLGGGNPYLSFDSAMVAMANVLALKLTDGQNLLALQQKGDTASFQAQVLSQNPENEEPFIQVSASGHDAAVVERTLQGAVASLNIQLSGLQAGMPAAQRASLEIITQDPGPTRSGSAKLKPLVGFLGVGLVLTFLIPQAVEGVARRRKRPAVTAPPSDQPAPKTVALGAQSDQLSPSRTPAARSENVKVVRPDVQIDDEYGIPSRDDVRSS